MEKNNDCPIQIVGRRWTTIIAGRMEPFCIPGVQKIMRFILGRPSGLMHAYTEEREFSHELDNLFGRPCRRHHVRSFVLWAAIELALLS